MSTLILRATYSRSRDPHMFSLEYIIFRLNDKQAWDRTGRYWVSVGSSKSVSPPTVHTQRPEPDSNRHLQCIDFYDMSLRDSIARLRTTFSCGYVPNWTITSGSHTSLWLSRWDYGIYAITLFIFFQLTDEARRLAYFYSLRAQIVKHVGLRTANITASHYIGLAILPEQPW